VIRLGCDAGQLQLRRKNDPQKLAMLLGCARRVAQGRRPVYLSCVNYHEIITIEPDKRSGEPCIRGTRMTVTDVLEYLAGGMTHQELIEEFPDLTEEDIRACLAFAADRERRLAVLPE
jgi:uncharacterized protein (DUF433 family)